VTDHEEIGLAHEVRVMRREIDEMRGDVKTLVAAYARQQGRDEAAAQALRDATASNHERSAWYRTFIPLGAAAGLVSGLAWLRETLGIGQ
jgi:hypothetical protein